MAAPRPDVDARDPAVRRLLSMPLSEITAAIDRCVARWPGMSQDQIRLTPRPVHDALFDMTGCNWWEPHALDVCPAPPVPEDWDGLTSDWRTSSRTFDDRVWMNPPFSGDRVWFKRLLDASASGCWVAGVAWVPPKHIVDRMQGPLNFWAASEEGITVLDTLMGKGYARYLPKMYFPHP
eukprot:gene19825-55279_t